MCVCPKDVITDSGSTGASGGHSTTNAQAGGQKRNSGGTGTGNNLSNVGSAVGSALGKRSSGGAGDSKRPDSKGVPSGPDGRPSAARVNSGVRDEPNGGDRSPVAYEAKAGGKTIYDYQMAPSPRSGTEPAAAQAPPSPLALSNPGPTAPNQVVVSVAPNTQPANAPALAAAANASAAAAGKSRHKTGKSAMSTDFNVPPPPDRPASEEDILDEEAAPPPPATEMSVMPPASK
jgi:hypothetical protein